MKKIYFLFLLLVASAFAKAQLLSSNTAFMQETSTGVEIICDANFGNKGLLNYANTTDVYVHVGAITTASTSYTDWKGVPFTWATTNALANAVYMGNGKWKYTITSNLRSFFNITNSAEKIVRIAILFRSGNGNKVLRNTDGSDMYLPVYDNGLYTRIDNPNRTPFYNMGVDFLSKSVGDKVYITANSSQTSDISLYFNGNLISTTAGAIQAIDSAIITASGSQMLVAKSVNGGNTAYDTVRFYVAGAINFAPLPSGITKDGVYYNSTDSTVVTLVQYAPKKQGCIVIGDFNNWTESLAYQMNVTPDTNYYWIKVTGLTPGVEYSYQFKYDGYLTVADYNAEKVLDPWNDQYISVANYPNLKPYPVGKTTGIVSVLQTNKPKYQFQYSFTRPNKKNLIIYEMLVRDFVSNKSFQAVKDSIPYLKKMGINALQLMPVMEFEGNNSWGYNPAYFFAVDKYYGTPTALKQLIDECHNNGIAVILDIALNHAFGSCPMVQMYFDNGINRPLLTNPWFNQADKHPYGVGYDFNHESAATKSFVDRVITHWLTEYKIDGFRWDLSKGFTQKQTSDVGAWGAYDASRIAIWKRIYDKMQTVSSGSYCILEHFADNSEEIELSNYGMLLWGNANGNMREAAKAKTSNTDFGYSLVHSVRGWSNAHLVGYAESHDEERLMYDNITDGNNAGSYNTKDTTTALKRMQMMACFLAMAPGPKMVWQMGELGYDYSINYCTNGTINSGCRLEEKPVRWDYRNNSNRAALYNTYSKLFALRTHLTYANAFISGAVSANTGGTQFKQITVGNGTLLVVVVGNIGTTAVTQNVGFPTTGTWYNLLGSTNITVTGVNYNMTLQPGEFYVYTNKNVNSVLPIHNAGNEIPTITNQTNFDLNVFPNPINASSIISYSLPAYASTTISLVDASGRIIQELYSGNQSKGNYTLSLKNIAKNYGKLSDGLYFIRLNSNNKTILKKILLTN